MDASRENAPSKSSGQQQRRDDENTQTGYEGFAYPSMAPFSGNLADNQEAVHRCEVEVEKVHARERRWGGGDEGFRHRDQPVRYP